MIETRYVLGNVTAEFLNISYMKYMLHSIEGHSALQRCRACAVEEAAT
jgi:hypothetical protein